MCDGNIDTSQYLLISFDRNKVGNCDLYSWKEEVKTQRIVYYMFA